MNKRWLYRSRWTFIIVLAVCIPAGHTQGNSGQLHSSSDGQQQRSSTVLGKYDPPIKVSFVRETGEDLQRMIDQLPDETLTNNRWTRLYEQELGIQIHYDWIATGDVYHQKMGVSLAAGRFPDVVKVNPYQLRQLSNAGLIEDLTEVYRTHASPLTKKILEAEGRGAFDAATIDGNLMAIPESSSSIETAQYLWIRTDWLERLGLQPPETMEDVLHISKAFTAQDPNGNGIQDTYGLALTSYLWDPVMGATGFMAGYGAYPNIWIKDENGDLKYGGIQPEVRTALEVLQKLYLEGQIDPDFSYKNGNKAYRLVQDGQIGMLYGEQWAPFMLQTTRDTDPNAQWQAYPIVAESNRALLVPLRSNTGQYFAVKKGFAYPEIVVKLMNMHLDKNWGEEAEYETYYNDDSRAVWMLSPVTPFPGTKNMDAYRQIRDARETGDFSSLENEALAIHKRIVAYEAEGLMSGWGWKQTYGPTGAFSIADTYDQNGQLLNDEFTGGITDTMIDRQTILRDLQLEAYMNIILGSPIEEFDQFVQNWRKLGGDEITSEVNAWFKMNTAMNHQPSTLSRANR
ncbi:putative aldouronate transport system substrate-binding protein [Paenibacillus amylolyticus]|uniref:Aldouronate transport system substrate-binding protein n=1 Tax=Paenibacillus amylolyticus TaxID=1451 RepID=A0AAP5GWD6_PAEAM|nr:extracellular solute-binding protein [Paenibacillus amylolyticus]MDR6721785.1 putative aldouronate transport system substrate-binding protein [Paenibacillus amylolyticus]